jgi:hypothetical protein
LPVSAAQDRPGRAAPIANRSHRRALTLRCSWSDNNRAVPRRRSTRARLAEAYFVTLSASPSRQCRDVIAGGKYPFHAEAEVKTGRVHRCAQRPRSALVASASASAFHFRGTHEILM